MIRWYRTLGAACAALALVAAAAAHEVRPAYLEIEQRANGQVEVLWKQPAAGNAALPLRPVLSSGWLDPDTADSNYADAYLTRRWSIPHPGEPLAGQQLTIEGLERSMTDVLLRIAFADGSESLHLIKPDAPALILPSATRATPAVAHYTVLGVEHIWTGFDHLLFVLGLILLAIARPGFRLTHDLLQTITAFTVAHSITLAAATTRVITVPSVPVEAVIALSIVYLAVELVRARRGQNSVAVRWPWVIAFAFGLLHGFGFAGALGEVGLPVDRIPLALLLFNIGIELGQLVFVGAVLLLYRVLTVTPAAWSSMQSLMPHVIGSLAAFLFLERTWTALAP